MKNLLAILFLIAAIASLFSCEDQNPYYEGYEPTIIVDGKIEINNFPKVTLTRNIPYYVNIDSSDLFYLVLKQAKITVYNDTESEVLTLKLNDKEFPYYFYEGTRLKGKAGVKYYLKIEHGNNIITANTSIPNPVRFDKVWFQPVTTKDSLGRIHATLTDDATQHNYYRTYTMITNRQNQYYPTLVSNFDDRLFNGETFTFELNKGPETFLDIQNADFYFKKGDTIFLKVCTVDERTHEFWKSYQYEVANGANPFASSYHKIESNIEGDGKGIWAGYGSTLYQIIAK